MQKQLILFFIFLLTNLSLMMAQDNLNYATEWKKVTGFDRQGQPKSALQITEAIYKRAKKDKNTNQIIKSLVYRSKYAMTLTENTQLKIITDFETEIKQSGFPIKNILESMLASLYWNYFEQNRWQFYNRTKTAQKVNPDDFRTWDLETLFAEIHVHYQQSLNNSKEAQQTDITKFNDILSTAEGSKLYRPSLYDFLAHRALDFYTSSETNITKPAYAFVIDNPKYLANHQEFLGIKTSSKDTLSLQLQAIQMYQRLLKFHEKDRKPDALIDATIKRLKFVYANCTIDNKEEVFLQTLLSEKQKYNSTPSRTLYDYEIAKHYQQQAAKYIPGKDNTHRWKLKKALEICQDAIKNFPSAKGTANCKFLKEQILKKEIKTISLENYIPINKPSRLLVNYKNIDQLYFSILKINTDQMSALKRLHKRVDQVNYLNKLSAVTSWDAKLKNENDYQRHTTEIVVPKLPTGTYLIVCSTTNALSAQNTFAFEHLQVTDLVLIENNTNNGQKFVVVNRNNGAPIPNATVTLTSKNRNRPLNEKHSTDKKGEIVCTKKGYHYNVQATVQKDNDIAHFGGIYLQEQRDRSEKNTKTQYTSFLFTDRKIYRPGQTVYFKGIMMESKGDALPKVIADKKTFAKLIDANGQEIKKIDFVTNAYGSFAGEFILPADGLTGNYSIQTFNYNSTSFSVEEYKRPKFEAEFAPITKTHTLNDQIEVKGNALAYAGSSITNAKVVYRVYRQVQYPRWCYWFPTYGSTSQEITHGETATDNTGAFMISFAALPDASVDKKNQPVFRYQVTADITDINGETRSCSTVVNIGYHALNASITVLNNINKTQKDHTIQITTKNLNDQFVANDGQVKIYKLKPPTQPLRIRPWDAPDYPLLEKKAFKELFPHDAYANEDDYRNWEKGTLVLDKAYTTKATKDLKKGNAEIMLGGIKKWKSGRYLIELRTKDRFGQEVKDLSYIMVHDPTETASADQKLIELTTDKDSYAIGDEVKLKISSASKDITIALDIEKDHKLIDSQLITLSNTSKTIKIPVREDDLGGFSVSYSFVNYNSFESHTLLIDVPYPPSELQIETKTFRDKLLPGQKENWSFSIKGPKGDQVAAELLASMYDASLDQFRENKWSFDPINMPKYYAYYQRRGKISFGNKSFSIYKYHDQTASFYQQQYDQLNWFGLEFGRTISPRRRMMMKSMSPQGPGGVMESARMSAPMKEMEAEVTEDAGFAMVQNESMDLNELSDKGIDSLKTDSKKKKTKLSGVSIRKNLQETAFFYPQLTTDAQGTVSFNFTAPESLTSWNVQLLAHNKQMHSTIEKLETVTQKELMVLPNPPRFLREGDKIILSSKIANLAAKALSGVIELQLTDALTGTPIDTKLQNTEAQQNFSIAAGANANASWELTIPDDIQTVHYKIIAKAGDFSDGEQNVLPILSNRMLVTETLPMWIKSDETKTFTLDKLKENTSTTLTHHRLTLEMTSNPTWYAVQALPYLMEYPYENSEQIFARYYANTLATYITNAHPKIQEVFRQWKNTDALLSNLEKNQELKSLIIKETPWLRDAQSETEQKKRIALLFDLNKMNSELQSTLRKLSQMQLGSGGFPWCKGGRENRYITQHIIAGFGHLKKLGVAHVDPQTQKTIKQALRYLDQEFIREYNELKIYCERNKIDINKDHLSHMQLHYLYMRSFFADIKRTNGTNEAWNYYLEQSKKYWLQRNLYSQGLLSLLLHRNNETTTAAKIIKSLDEKSITNEELGMYWKSNTPSWYWHQAPIETQALLIEAFGEIESEPKRTQTIDQLKVWLLKNKQTNRWKTTKATTAAIYALLLQGSDWISITDMVAISLGKQEIQPSKLENSAVEAGTGYFKTSWSKQEIEPQMATATITKKGKGIAWGALYWQYFENLDKITAAETPLKIKKRLFLKKNSDRGEEISEINANTNLQLGDIVRVRIELRSDRTMEFVHMKDMRASGLEPIHVLSQYKWQDGLGYYESTKEASTDFFFDYLSKGVYVFEYDLRVNNKGDFSNGITTIQSMYAPEFSSHSKGERIKVK